MYLEIGLSHRSRKFIAILELAKFRPTPCTGQNKKFQDFRQNDQNFEAAFNFRAKSGFILQILWSLTEFSHTIILFLNTIRKTSSVVSHVFRNVSKISQV